jgi:hypothetical protein
MQELVIGAAAPLVPVIQRQGGYLAVVGRRAFPGGPGNKPRQPRAGKRAAGRFHGSRSYARTRLRSVWRTEPASRCSRYSRAPPARLTRPGVLPARKRGHSVTPADRKESKMQIGEPQRIYEIPEPETVPDDAPDAQPDAEPARVPERHEPVPG